MLCLHGPASRAKDRPRGAANRPATHQHGVRPVGKEDAAIGLRGDVEVARRRPCCSSGHFHVGHACQPFCAAAISIGVVHALGFGPIPAPATSFGAFTQ